MSRCAEWRFKPKQKVQAEIRGDAVERALAAKNLLEVSVFSERLGRVKSVCARESFDPVAAWRLHERTLAGF